MINEHEAKKAGHHFDIRLEVPLNLIDETFKEYKEKRTKETPEPMPKDKTETGLLSFVSKKEEPFPNKSKDSVYVIKSELHPIEYLSFSGKIPEGSYGAGEIKIYDTGKYELINLTDKKIDFNIEGKFEGNYSLIRMGEDKVWKLIKNK